MKIAFVYDRVNTWGGAERVLLELHELWPEAPLYTAVYDAKEASWAKVFRVHPSFLQAIPFAKRHHQWFPWLTPLAFETFSFDQFDVVISITSAEAKNIITKPECFHICYCLTPTRYLWSGYETYRHMPGLGWSSGLIRSVLPKLIRILRRWDLHSATRPDIYVAISQQVKQRIETYYHRQVESVIYPPVDTDWFQIDSTRPKPSQFLVVSRLVSYKRIDLVIEAFNQLGLPLTIIGRGKDEARLRKLAGSTITFITDRLTEVELRRYYQDSRAFVFAGQEDFGIVAAEAQACGIPVLCFADSGMAEIIQPGKTGEVFNEQTVAAIVATLSLFQNRSYQPEACRRQAVRFSRQVFRRQMKFLVEQKRKVYYSNTYL